MAGPANSESPATVFPDPVHPEQEPFQSMPSPPHISFQIWQDSWYDASSHAPMGAFAQRPAGPCDIATGRLLDGDWPASGGPWEQV
jgi:hypothetical protein